MKRFSYRGPMVVTVAALVFVLAWDASSLDLAAARLFGLPHGFPWRDSRALVLWMHEVPRFASWALVVALFAAIRWPIGIWHQLDVRERAQLAVTVLASVLVVSLIKTHSRTSCPWDLQAFGGIARYVSHWRLGVDDGGPGKCFPAGHASAAFAYVGGWFVWRRRAPAIAWRWLVFAALAGVVLGIGQQMRGAHYMSHTLWTAWICWGVGFSIDLLAAPWRHASAALRLKANLNHS